MMKQSRGALRLLATAALAAGLAAGAAQAAGPQPIDGCTTIDQPGSYILTRNITASNLEQSEGCIEVAADHVTLDLNGFALMGDGTGAGIFDGGAEREGLSLRNGTVANFNIGIRLFEASRCTLQDLRVLNNTATGVSANGGACIVFGNIAAENMNTGLRAFSAPTLMSGNISRGNALGFHAGNGVFTRNVAGGNSDGILVINSLITGNAVHGNTGPGDAGLGIFPGIRFAITNNAITANDEGIFYGPSLSDGALVIYNTFRSNTDGNQVGVCDDCTIVHNRF